MYTPEAWGADESVDSGNIKENSFDGRIEPLENFYLFESEN
jgi:hypothetical protein